MGVSEELARRSPAGHGARRVALAGGLAVVAVAVGSGGAHAQSRLRAGDASGLTTRPLPTCPTRQLSIAVRDDVSGGGDHAGFDLVFRNHGPGACQLYGYPGVAGLDRAGREVVEARRTLNGYIGGPKRVSTVRLASGGVASALFEGEIGRTSGGPPCPRFVAVRVTPPNDRRSVRLALNTICYPEIHPVVAGSHAGAIS